VTQATAPASLPVLRALLDQARRKNYTSGVLGVHARPQWSGPRDFVHAGVPVRVAACVSALAVREALLGRAAGHWLVVLTDRPDDDLGAGVLSHLIGHRLRTPDPWEAVRHRFAATGIDPALTAAASHREIATGLLMATPAAGWPPAPGGVLTRDHALGALAAAHLGLTDPVVDATSVLTWTADPATPARVADLRAIAGDAVTDAALDWAAGRSGAAAGPLLRLLRAGEGRDAIPLGLVAGLLADTGGSRSAQAAQLAREALIRLEPRLGALPPPPASLRSWAAESAAIVTGLLRDTAGRASGEILLARADELLAQCQAATLAGGSDLLPAGLTGRFAALADTLRGAADAPQISPDGLAAVEQAWLRVATHRLADADPRTAAFHAAVRLTRWLAAGSAVPVTFQALLERHGDSDAWVDSAINDAAPGTSDPALGAGLAAVLTVASARRAAHDGAFAAALAAHTAGEGAVGPAGVGGVWHLEDILPRVVLPLARTAPVLLLVLDGMSAGVGAEVVASVLSRTADGWAEALFPGQDRRVAALAVLPTLTEVSRTSLLCGELRTGGRDDERRGYAGLTRAHGLPGAALFHKKPLDSSRLGYAVADDVAAAIADVTGQPLVTCVLNTIDDALDRADPGGTEWGAVTVKHLAPLLECARRAGRVVVLTADHGHVVERRHGVQRAHTGISSGRSRAAVAAEPAEDGEVLVAGPRVLLHDGRAVLAVAEQLRYGPLKAGYHGGAAPAEAVVPVAVLVPGAIPEDTGLRFAPPQEPAWWTDPAGAAAAAVPLARPRPGAARRSGRPADPRGATAAVPTLFDEPAAAGPGPAGPGPGATAAGAQVAAASPALPGAAAGPLAAAVVASAAYAAQKKTAGRVSATDDDIRCLLGALLAAPGHRLAPALAATALAVSPVALRGAVLHAQRLLNVEGYAVVRVDADGATVILDEELMREQFGIGP
jgi:hypothetical protein